MSTSKYTRTNSTYKKHNLELPKIRQMIDEYNNGCLTQAQICAKYNIPMSTFSYYKNSSKSTRGKVQPSQEDYELCSERTSARSGKIPQQTQQHAGSQQYTDTQSHRQAYTEVKQPAKIMEVSYNEHPRVRHTGQVYESVEIQQPRKKVERISNGELDKLFHMQKYTQ